MNVYVILGVVGLVCLIANLFVGFQLRDRLDKLIEKK